MISSLLLWQQCVFQLGVHLLIIRQNIVQTMFLGCNIFFMKIRILQLVYQWKSFIKHCLLIRCQLIYICNWSVHTTYVHWRHASIHSTCRRSIHIHSWSHGRVVGISWRLIDRWRWPIVIWIWWVIGLISHIGILIMRWIVVVCFWLVVWVWVYLRHLVSESWRHAVIGVYIWSGIVVVVVIVVIIGRVAAVVVSLTVWARVAVISIEIVAIVV